MGRPPAAAFELVALAGVLFLAGRRRPAALAVAAFIPNILNQGIKALIERPRPEECLDCAIQVLVESGSATYPSGHLVHFTLLFGLLLYLATSGHMSRQLKMAVAATIGVAILLVGTSRVYLGAHWASDVLGGFLWGLLYLAVMLYFYQRWRRPDMQTPER